MKAYTIAPDVPLRRARPRTLPRALAALGRGHRLSRPGRRRRGDPALPRASAPPRRDEVRADAELDRRCRLPPGLCRAADGLARRAPGRARRGSAHKRATSPLQVFDVKTPHVRAALADAPKIGDSLCAECRAHFDDVRRYLDGYGVPLHDRALARPRPRLLRANHVGVPRPRRERELDDLRRRPLRRARGGRRRAADARRRVRCGPRAAAARPRERRPPRLARRPRRLLRARRRCAAGPRASAPRRGAAGRAQRRHRLRRPLAEGPDDAGRPDRRARGGDRPRDRCRGPHRVARSASWRSTTWSLRSRPDEQMARSTGKPAAAGR